MARAKTRIQRTIDEYRSDYEMSRDTRFNRRRTGLAPQGGSADYHYRSESNYYNDIEKARDLDRNDSVVGQITDRVVNNIVQDGFTLEPNTGDKGLDDELFYRWRDWSTDPDQCDVQGELTFANMEWQLYRSMLVDGDSFALGTSEGALQVFEGHSIRTGTKQPRTILGVTLDKFRKRLQYWVATDVIEASSNRKEKARAINVRDDEGNRQFFHLYDPKRSTATRGVTAYAPIFNIAGMLDDVQFAKLVQAQVASCFTILRTFMFGSDGDLPSATAAYDGSTTTTSSAGGTVTVKNLSPGQEITGRPGEKLEGFSPSIPNSEYFPHIKSLLTLIGVNLGLPLCMSLMDGSETNFSGWRGAYDEAKKGFRHGQCNARNRFNRPAYEWKVRQWMADGLVSERLAKRKNIAVLNHVWRAPTFRYIQPVEEAQGQILQLQGNLKSPRQLLGEQNADWEEVVDQSVEDNAYAVMLAKTKAAEINKKFDDGQPVDWRELVRMPLSPGIQIGLQPQSQQQAQTQPAPQGAA